MVIFRTIAKISQMYCWGIFIWAILYSHQERNKLLPSLAPVDAVFGSYSHQNGDYSQLPFWVTTVAEIVAISDDYSHRKWRQIVGLRTAKTIRFNSKSQIVSPLFDSKWKTTIRTALS